MPLPLALWALIAGGKDAPSDGFLTGNVSFPVVHSCVRLHDHTTMIPTLTDDSTDKTTAGALMLADTTEQLHKPDSLLIEVEVSPLWHSYHAKLLHANLRLSAVDVPNTTLAAMPTESLTDHASMAALPTTVTCRDLVLSSDAYVFRGPVAFVHIVEPVNLGLGGFAPGISPCVLVDIWLTFWLLVADIINETAIFAAFGDVEPHLFSLVSREDFTAFLLPFFDELREYNALEWKSARKKRAACEGHRLMLPRRRLVLPKTSRRHHGRTGCLSSAPLPRPPNQSWRLSARPCSITGLFLGAYFLAWAGVLGAAATISYASWSFSTQMLVIGLLAGRMIRWGALVRLIGACTAYLLAVGLGRFFSVISSVIAFLFNLAYSPTTTASLMYRRGCINAVAAVSLAFHYLRLRAMLVALGTDVLRDHAERSLLRSSATFLKEVSSPDGPTIWAVRNDGDTTWGLHSCIVVQASTGRRVVLHVLGHISQSCTDSFAILPGEVAQVRVFTSAQWYARQRRTLWKRKRATSANPDASPPISSETLRRPLWGLFNINIGRSVCTRLLIPSFAPRIIAITGWVQVACRYVISTCHDIDHALGLRLEFDLEVYADALEYYSRYSCSAFHFTFLASYFHHLFDRLTCALTLLSLARHRLGSARLTMLILFAVFVVFAETGGDDDDRTGRGKPPTFSAATAAACPTAAAACSATAASYSW